MPPRIDWTILLTLLLMLGGAVYAYRGLVRDLTLTRRRVILREWAKQQRFRVSSKLPPLPVELDRFGGVGARPLLHLGGGDVDLFMLATHTPDHPEPRTWHIAVAKTTATHLPVALRPSDAPTSLIDLAGLNASPITRPGHRFAVFADDVRAARRLIDGPMRGLLPGDLGLLRDRHMLLLDFTARPFDPIELSRIVALIRQLAPLA